MIDGHVGSSVIDIADDEAYIAHVASHSSTGNEHGCFDPLSRFDLLYGRACTSSGYEEHNTPRPRIVYVSQ